MNICFMHPKISVIVPVYNAEPYLRRCVDSILSQTFSDFELLLIDDGSKDQSGAICDEYADRDARVRVFHKANGGVSSARNVGLDHARGEWITFCDSDDWVIADTLCSDIGNYKEDLLIYSYFTATQGAMRLHELQKCLLLDRESLSEYCGRNLICSIFKAPWSKFFKKSRIQRFRFNEKIRLGEDTLFMLEVLGHIQSCRVLTTPFYVYNVNDPVVKYKLSIAESIYTMKELFRAYDSLGVKSRLAEKYFFVDYKLYCQDEINKTPESWFKDPFVISLYNRVKKSLGLNYRFRYCLLSNRIVFSLNRLLKSKGWIGNPSIHE